MAPSTTAVDREKEKEEEEAERLEDLAKRDRVVRLVHYWQRSQKALTLLSIWREEEEGGKRRVRDRAGERKRCHFVCTKGFHLSLPPSP